jgi:stalled ribosome rescue protein Dom34
VEYNQRHIGGKVTKLSQKRYRRGYPVAVLLGIEQNQAAIWKIYSNVAKPEKTIPLSGDRRDQKALYNFHEALVNALRPTIKEEGVKSIIAASPPRTGYAQEFINHVKAHHSWLLSGESKASLSQITGSAVSAAQVAALTRTDQFKELIQQTTIQETENLHEILEKRLSTQDKYVLFSLQEAEYAIYGTQSIGKPVPEYLLLTDNYLADTRMKSRVYKLMQVAQNRKIKTRIVSQESAAGARLNQLGGIVCLLKPQ